MPVVSFTTPLNFRKHANLIKGLFPDLKRQNQYHYYHPMKAFKVFRNPLQSQYHNIKDAKTLMVFEHGVPQDLDVKDWVETLEIDPDDENALVKIAWLMHDANTLDKKLRFNSHSK